CCSMNASSSATCDAIIFFFFFQAEDGIRDYKVTGVQTCALPICLNSLWIHDSYYERDAVTFATAVAAGLAADRRPADPSFRVARSEERRVGKECRSRGGAEQ